MAPLYPATDKVQYAHKGYPVLREAYNLMTKQVQASQLRRGSREYQHGSLRVVNEGRDHRVDHGKQVAVMPAEEVFQDDVLTLRSYGPCSRESLPVAVHQSRLVIARRLSGNGGNSQASQEDFSTLYKPSFYLFGLPERG
ncbi:hypothetical protein S7711_10917 [Stachybotrys chartarum IBT 7711]|uniref:Uncharacterized protein n=1 Tax=Stachybotrys chartarum (strain CBS 109288 / IBT 7711) TaxID=1280523 RepID=A0A084ARE5_STACB|nr:hypothetical protein S7711_10917 [Stachybotrys chartarum IBT 7711]